MEYVVHYVIHRLTHHIQLNRIIELYMAEGGQSHGSMVDQPYLLRFIIFPAIRRGLEESSRQLSRPQEVIPIG
jgi:hypothetical protein